MSRYLNRRVVLVIILVLTLGTFLPPLISVSRFRFRVADALSRALGRPVSIGAVHLRLLPLPALDLERVVVQDDPAFSAEPLLRSDHVTAALRFSSLWGGRLEIARLSLAYPSLNLVRAPGGHWNLESLLERARQTPTAPTPKRSAGARPRFPYVEAQGGRINLKLGAEKTVYALSQADFALSLPAENVWQLRLSARPVRTDANLSDTGTVRISGTIQRGSTLTDTPLDLRVNIEGAQLGQLTTLIYGRDRGWRGTVNASSALRGTPAALKITGDASVDDFRRYDIATRGSVRLAAHCIAGFSTRTQQVTDIACHAPVSGGTVEVEGGVDGVLPPRAFILSVTAKKLPATSLLALAQRMKKDLPEDLQASGTVDATFHLQPRTWTGTGKTLSLRLNSKLMSVPLELGQLALVLGLPEAARGKDTLPITPAVTVLRIGQFPLDLGAPAPAKVKASFSRGGYHIDVQGDARLNRLLELAHALGVPAPQVSVSGLATTDIEVAGNWRGFAAPVATGNLHLRAATVVIPGVNAPLQVASAALHLTPDAAAIYHVVGNFSGTHLSFTGSVQVPRICPAGSAGPCSIAFQMRADQLSTDELNRLLNPRLQKRPWYDLVGASQPRPALLAKVTAVGKLSATRLEVKSLTAKHATGDVRLEAGVLTVRNLKADILGGSTTAELRADFTGAQPDYTVKGALQQASVAAIAAITRDAWATGQANASYQVTASGWDTSQIRASATGSVKFDCRDCSLLHVALNGAAAPLKVRQFQGELALANGQLTFQPSRMETPGGIYVVSGTASLDRRLGLRLMRGKTEAYDVTGTVEKPRVTPAVPRPTQTAAIKP